MAENDPLNLEPINQAPYAPQGSEQVHILDLSGDALLVLPRDWAKDGGVSLTLLAENPEEDTVSYDLDGATRLRDTLTRMIDAQKGVEQ